MILIPQPQEYETIREHFKRLDYRISKLNLQWFFAGEFLRSYQNALVLNSIPPFKQPLYVPSLKKYPTHEHFPCQNTATLQKQFKYWSFYVL
jgi:hypothetical protein